MSGRSLGAQIDLTTTEIQFDPANGQTMVQEFEGTPNACADAYNNFLALGGRPSLSQKGGMHTVTVRWAYTDQNVGGVETPNDSYSLDMEEVQPSIWTHPQVTDAADASGDPYKWRKGIEDYIKNPDSALRVPGGLAAEVLGIYLLRGGTSFASHTPVLSRQRTFSTKYPTKIKVVAIEPVYTTSALITHFGIPTAVAIQLPDDPPPSAGATPSETVWGWKLRRQNSRFVPALAKVEETMDWVYSAWQAWVYPVVTS